MMIDLNLLQSGRYIVWIWTKIKHPSQIKISLDSIPRISYKLLIVQYRFFVADPYVDVCFLLVSVLTIVV
jgi:hypothetical protein